MKNISAYYSNSNKSWVRLEREIDGEYCHTSGYSSKEEALNSEIETKNRLFDKYGMPSFLSENYEPNS